MNLNKYRAERGQGTFYFNRRLQETWKSSLSPFLFREKES